MSDQKESTFVPIESKEESQCFFTKYLSTHSRENQLLTTGYNTSIKQ